MKTQIIFNGQQYDSPEAMPPDVRAAYQKVLAQLADTDKNGIPDVLERSSAARNVIGARHSSISINGREYKNLNEMPPPVRLLYEKVMQQVDKNRNGLPDALEARGPEKGAQLPAVEETDRASLLNPRTRPALLVALLLGGLVMLYFWLRQAQR